MSKRFEEKYELHRPGWIFQHLSHLRRLIIAKCVRLHHRILGMLIIAILGQVLVVKQISQ